MSTSSSPTYEDPPLKATKRRTRPEANNNDTTAKRSRMTPKCRPRSPPTTSRSSTSTSSAASDMLQTYQPWVVRTYGDLAKTKTVTLCKYARIVRTLRGHEPQTADSSKFRFWVRAKGFHVGVPLGYDPKPADAIVGRFSVCDTDGGIEPDGEGFGSAKDPPLYVPNQPFKVGF